MHTLQTLFLASFMLPMLCQAAVRVDEQSRLLEPGQVELSDSVLSHHNKPKDEDLKFNVLIIRHAECHVPACGPNLCPAGVERANFLPSLFKVGNESSNEESLFESVDKIYALDPKKPPYITREYDTVIPLANVSNIPINEDYGRDEEPDLVDDIFTADTLRDMRENDTVLISWRHTQIYKLGQLLGCNGTVHEWCEPDTWPVDEFDKMLYIELFANRTLLNASLLSMDYDPNCDNQCIYAEYCPFMKKLFGQCEECDHPNLDL